MADNVIAIDGPAASGKSTIAQRVSEYFQVPYISTGAMYRAIAWKAITAGITPENLSETAITPVLGKLQMDYVNTPDGWKLQVNSEFPDAELRDPEVSALSSAAAALPAVRQWLLEKQRSMAAIGRIVMEGRDIGTVIFPNAKFKFFLTASPLVRAKRRLAQGGESSGANIEAVAKEIAERDERDRNRPIAPLKQARNAVLIDSSDLTIDEVVRKVTSYIED